MSQKEIATDFPEISTADLSAALSFAACREPNSRILLSS
jgi:uncharacterized protein (DUF433 family)